MKAFEYCDAVKEKVGIESHYALAKRLGIAKQSITKLYAGGTFSNETALKVAEILEIDPLIVIADSEIEKAKVPEIRAVWENLAARIAAAVVMGVGVGGMVASLMPPDALPLLDGVRSVCILCKIDGAAQIIDLTPFYLAMALVGFLLARRTR